MDAQSFFEEAREQSRVKSLIVTKYFGAWAKVMIRAATAHGGPISYMDLFAGPGLYSDCTPSTPIIVLREAISDDALRETLVTVFNDKDPANTQLLREAIDALPGIETLRYKPTVETEEIGPKIAEIFRRVRLVPTLLFVDPWGYKGLSLALIGSVLRNWGCDCVFFFNYNRVSPGLSNDVVREHMNDIFGEDRANAIRVRLAGLGPEERESLIIEALSLGLRDVGARYVLPFTFKNEHGTRTTHYLIFCTKNFRGYAIMKEIMAGESSGQEQGVASFAYSPASKRFPTLFGLTTPLDDLEAMLLMEFAGQTIKTRAIYERHSVGRPYVEKNYKQALIRLEAAGRVTARPPAEKRKKVKGNVTFGDNVVVSFPSGAKV